MNPKSPVIAALLFAASAFAVACSQEAAPAIPAPAQEEAPADGAEDPAAAGEGTDPSAPKPPPAKGGSSSGGSSSGGSGGKGGSSSGEAGSSGGVAPVDEHPSWLVAPSYTKGYKEENNVYFESDDAGIRFHGAPSYQYEEKLGKTWSTKGTWKVSNGNLVLTPTYASAQTIALASAMKANCRVFDRPGYARTFASGRVTGCPYKTPLTATECAKAGSYVKNEKYESSSGAYYSSSSYTTRYDIEGDGFIRYTTSSFKFTCYGASCKDLSSQSAPIVGRYWVDASGAIKSDATTVNVAGFTFTKSSASCVQ